MRIPSFKTIVSVLAIIEVWLLLQVPSIGDQVFNFVVAGEVPGSDKVLSPSEMMLFLAGVFVLAAGLIFKKEILAAFTKVDAVEAPLPVTKPAKKPRPQAMAKVRKPRPAFVQGLAAKTGPYVTAVKAYAAKYASQAWSVAAPLLQRTWQAAGRAALAVQRAIVWLCAMEVYLLYRTGVFVATRTVRFWRWLRPAIERSDRWIEHKLRQNDQSATILNVGSELVSTVRGWAVWFRSTRN